MTSPYNILAFHNMYAKKKLGQNFLKDPSMCDMIVNRTQLEPNSIVVEIGPGLGAITVPSARKAKKIYAIEKDARLIPLLKAELLAARADNVEVINQDILKTDLSAFAANHASPLIITGNLPYNISSQILIKLVHERQYIDRAVFMFQKELAERLVSPPGTKNYGRLSVVMQYCSTIHHIASVPPQCFHPAPAVDSTVIAVDFHPQTALSGANEIFLFSVIKAAFSKRRKNLKNALSTSELKLETDTVVKSLANAGIDPKRRAETLSVDEFITLSQSIEQFSL